MKFRSPLILATLALTVSACADESPAPSTQPARIQQDKAPHAITCADLADKQASAAMSRRAQFALADEAAVEDMSRLRVAQSIFFAMTELCEDADQSYTPATDAVRAVRDGRYLADLEAP